MRAADDALIAMTSCGFSMSTPTTLTTICVSLRKPSGNAGRSGRSIRRHVRIACSDGRPSRRKNAPGILPAAYARSSTSTVSGKKSMPSRTPRAALAVTRTVVPSIDARTAPCDCVASFPVSNDMVFSEPVTCVETRMASAMGTPLFVCCCSSAYNQPVPSRQPRPMARDNRLTTDNNKNGVGGRFCYRRRPSCAMSSR